MTASAIEFSSFDNSLIVGFKKYYPDYVIHYLKEPSTAPGSLQPYYFSTDVGEHVFGTMRISQQTGNLYLCNYHTTDETLEFHRIKLMGTTFA